MTYHIESGQCEIALDIKEEKESLKLK